MRLPSSLLAPALLLIVACAPPALQWSQRPATPTGNAWHCTRSACEPARDACLAYAETFARFRAATHERAPVASPCQSSQVAACFTYHSRSTGLDQTRMISTRSTGPVAWRFSCWDSVAVCERYRQQEADNGTRTQAVSPCQEWR